MSILTILLFLLSGTTYYVSSTQGDDQNKGIGPDSAWETLDRVNKQTLSPGDHVRFLSGDEFIGQLVISNSGIKGLPIMFGSYGEGKKPILNAALSPGGAHLSTILIRNQSFIELDDLEITNNRLVSREGTDDKQGYGIFVHNNGNHIMQHFKFRNLTVREVFAITTAGIAFDNLQVAGIYFRSERNNAVGQEKHIRDILIEDSYITLTGKFGIWTQHGGGAGGIGDEIINRNKNLVFRNNHTYKTGGSGITPGRSYNVLMEHNIFEFPGSNEDDRMAKRGSGAWFFGGRNIIAQYNTIISARGNNDTYSIQIDHSNENVFVQFNYSQDSEGGFAEILGENINSVYRYNVSINDGFRNNARSIWVSDYAGPNRDGIRSDKNYVYNNTIFVGQGRTPGIRLVGEDTFIHNNIFYTTDGSSIGNSELFVDISDGSKLKVSHNLYQGNIAAGFMNRDAHSVFADPLFEEPGGFSKDSYRLSDDSPALQAGLAFDQPKFPMAGIGIFENIPEYPDTDQYGNPIIWQNGAVTIGAYAGSASAPTPGTEISIRGTLVNEDNEPVINLDIRLEDNGNLFEEAVTDGDGNFTFTFLSEERTLKLVTDSTSALQELQILNISALANAHLGRLIIPWVTGSVMDHEGNSYRTVRIGDQIWMAENLRAKTYANGDMITHAIENADWGSSNTSESGAWSFYNNDDSNGSDLGVMYNWFAVADERGLCPTGWKVPSDTEVQEMEQFLGMPDAELNETSFARGRDHEVGNQLRSISFWTNPNTGATNNTGFSFRSSGIRFAGGIFQDLPQWGAFWTSTNSESGAFRRVMRFNEAGINRNAANRGIGIAVRCIQMDETVSIDPDLNFPQELRLDQNYPNPFNPQTQIVFDIPQESHVHLSVYDALGRQLSVLVDEIRTPGSYYVSWDASRFASGIYIYRLETSGTVLSRKMTVIK